MKDKPNVFDEASQFQSRIARGTIENTASGNGVKGRATVSVRKFSIIRHGAENQLVSSLVILRKRQ